MADDDIELQRLELATAEQELSRFDMEHEVLAVQMEPHLLAVHECKTQISRLLQARDKVWARVRALRRAIALAQVGSVETLVEED